MLLGLRLIGDHERVAITKVREGVMFVTPDHQ
jgi:hypothetical protein